MGAGQARPSAPSRRRPCWSSAMVGRRSPTLHHRAVRAATASRMWHESAWPPSTGRRQAPPDWKAVVRALERRRASAYARGAPMALRRVYAPGTALRADLRQLQRALGAHGRARGLRADVVDVDVLHVRRGLAVLQVTDAW